MFPKKSNGGKISGSFLFGLQLKTEWKVFTECQMVSISFYFFFFLISFYLFAVVYLLD